MIFKVPYGQDPYSVIGKYIRDHITVIEDIIAVIKINEVETNQLFTVDTNEENYFIWETDWWEGEEDVALIDFFPVSEAQRANQSVQSADTISRQDAIDAFRKELCAVETESGREYAISFSGIKRILNDLPSAQPDIIRCRECKYHDKGSNESGSWNLCGYRPWQYVKTDDEHYCGYAERRTDE